MFDLTTNTIGTLNVLKAATELGIPKVVEASSAGVYGQAVTDLQDETHPTDPNWEYGVSKLACEKYAAIVVRAHTRPVRGQLALRDRLRRARMVRPGAHPLPERALDGHSPVVFGRGDQVRDFVYAGDIARLHRRCLEVDFAGHLVLNGSTAVGTSVLELANTICDVVGERMEPIFDDVSEGEVSELAGRPDAPAVGVAGDAHELRARPRRSSGGNPR